VVDPVGLLVVVVAAFAGGAFGAAVGALPALTLAGVALVVGELAELLGGAPPPTAGSPATLGATGLTASVGLGPFLGPQVAFAGGAAAAAFAARKGSLDHPFPYHHAKAVARPLGLRADALVAGGAFGVVGLLLTGLSAGTFGPVGGTLPWPGLPWDPLAFSIVVSGFLHRLAFGYPLVGTVRGGVLDMRPYARGERRGPPPTRRDEDASPPDAEELASTHLSRFVVEPWRPEQSDWVRVALVGVGAGVLAALVTYLTGRPLLAFGLAVASLAFVLVDDERIPDAFPVTYHVALPAGVAVVGLAGGATGGAVAAAVSPAVALVAGALVGTFAALVGEVAQRVLYAHADTHLDPPMVAILLTSFLLAVLDVAGVLTQNTIPTPF
jgi:hypothetical protein